jgi:hypothetical protein
VDRDAEAAAAGAAALGLCREGADQGREAARVAARVGDPIVRVPHLLKRQEGEGGDEDEEDDVEVDCDVSWANKKGPLPPLLRRL